MSRRTIDRRRILALSALLAGLIGAPAAAEDDPVTDAPVAREDASGPAMDYLQLDTSAIIGNRELPKVLYIVPWKNADLGDLPERPVNSLLEEVLAPVDRDEFRRQVDYYAQLYGPHTDSKTRSLGPVKPAEE